MQIGNGVEDFHGFNKKTCGISSQWTLRSMAMQRRLANASRKLRFKEIPRHSPAACFG